MKISRRQLRKLIKETFDDDDIDTVIKLMMDDFDYGLELLGYLEPPVSLRYVRANFQMKYI